MQLEVNCGAYDLGPSTPGVLIPLFPETQCRSPLPHQALRGDDRGHCGYCLLRRLQGLNYPQTEMDGRARPGSNRFCTRTGRLLSPVIIENHSFLCIMASSQLLARRRRCISNRRLMGGSGEEGG